MSFAYNAGMVFSPDEHYMQLALAQARLAAQMGEVPIGAVVVAGAGAGPGEARAEDEGRAASACAALADAAHGKADAAFCAPVASACNRRETDADPAAHAEFLAIEAAARALGRWRLSDCTVYVTLEPCIMCAGLMHQARVKRCVFGARDPKAGALGTLYAVHADERLNHRFEACGGVLADESAALLRGFFAGLREGR